jgi:hypothetical protein
MKLFGKGDLKVIRLRHSGSTHYFITPGEMRSVMANVGEVGYCLYSYYRTGFFNESEDFDDDVVGKVIGWADHKVKRYRLNLENAGLFKRVRHGTKQEGITKVLVGADTIALDNAGLPPDILDSRAFNKLKKAAGVTGTEDLVMHAQAMADMYAANPELYK